MHNILCIGVLRQDHIYNCCTTTVSGFLSQGLLSTTEKYHSCFFWLHTCWLPCLTCKFPPYYYSCYNMKENGFFVFIGIQVLLFCFDTVSSVHNLITHLFLYFSSLLESTIYIILLLCAFPLFSYYLLLQLS